MEKEKLMQEFIKATREFIEAERAYNDDELDVYEHMMLEDNMYNAREKMDELYDKLFK